MIYVLTNEITLDLIVSRLLFLPLSKIECSAAFILRDMVKFLMPNHG